MQVHHKVEGLKQCQCGGQPDTVTIGYGRTPYDVACPKCHKQTNSYKEIGGMIDNAVEFWNEIAPLEELRVDGNKLYEHCGHQLVHNQVRIELLDAAENGIKEPLYVLFKNGKIVEPDERRFLIKGIDW